MKILLVAPVFPPHRSAASLRTYTFARTWADAGHDVTVLSMTKRPNQLGEHLPATGFTVVDIPYRGPWLFERLRSVEHHEPAATSAATPTRRWRSSILGPLRTLKTRLGLFSSARQPDLTDFWVRPAMRWVKQHRPWDIVVSSGGPPAAYEVARQIRALGYARWWAADVRDLWVDNPFYVGLFPMTLLERHRERRILHQADCITTVSAGLAKRLRQKTTKPVEIIYNGYDLATFNTLPPEPVFPADGRPRIVYTGTTYKHAYDPRPLLHSLAVDPRWRLVVAGDQGEWWQKMAQQFGVADRLDYHGRVSRLDSLRMQRDATALLLLDFPDPRHGVLTGKIFEYMKSTAPILVIGGAVQSPAADLIVQTGRGLALGRNAQRTSETLRTILDDPTSLGLQPDQRLIAELSRDEQSKRFLRLFPSF